LFFVFEFLRPPYSKKEKRNEKEGAEAEGLRVGNPNGFSMLKARGTRGERLFPPINKFAILEVF
jgi:hypothetical protein